MKVRMKSTIALGAGVFAVAGIVAAPLVPAANAVTTNTTVNANVGSTISMTGGSTVSLVLNPGGNAVLTSASDAITVSTNSTAGYTLTLADSDANLNLASGANTIGPTSGTFAVPAAMTTNKWGFALPGGTGFDPTYNVENNSTTSTSKWAAISATAATLKNTSSTATNDPTTIWYAAKVDSSQPTGTNYQDQVVYTATAK